MSGRPAAQEEALAPTLGLREPQCTGREGSLSAGAEHLLMPLHICRETWGERSPEGSAVSREHLVALWINRFSAQTYVTHQYFLLVAVRTCLQIKTTPCWGVQHTPREEEPQTGLMQDGGTRGRASHLPPRAAAPPSLEPRSISGVWHLLCGSQGAPACAKPREVLLARNPISGAVFQSSGTFLSENTVCGIRFILSENFILLAKASWRREVPVLF